MPGIVYSGVFVKFLHLDLLFALPDDFDGDVTDAIQEFAAYMESKRTETPQQFTVVGPDQNTRWDRLQHGVAHGYRATGVWEVGQEVPLKDLL